MEMMNVTTSRVELDSRSGNIYPWDLLWADLARAIKEGEMYPEEMPDECFDII